MTPVTSFVGREHELALLVAALEACRDSGASSVVVTGPPGVGKTSLVRRFLATAAGIHTVEAAAHPDERDVPFGVLDQLVDANERLAAGESAMSAGSVLLNRVSNLGLDGKAVVIAIDDAPSIDGPSLRAITFALRRLRADHVLAVWTARDDEVFPVLESVRGIGLPHGELRLRGLSGNDLAELCHDRTGHRLSAAAAARLQEHTGGNPLLAEAVIDDLGAARLQRPDPLPSPRRATTWFASVVAELPIATRRLLAAVGVLGDRADRGALADLLEMDGEALIEVAEAAVDRRLLWVDDGRLCYTHPLVAAAARGSTTSLEWSDLHRRAAALSSGDARLDHLVAATVDTDEALAQELVQRAFAHLFSGQFVAAGHRLLSAARTSLGDDATRRLLDAVGMLLLGGELPDAFALSDEVLAAPPSARRSYVLAQLAAFGGDPDGARTHAVDAWSKIGPTDGDIVAALCLVSAQLAVLAGDGTEAVAWSLRPFEEKAMLPPGVGPRLKSRAAIGYGMLGRTNDGLAVVEDLAEDPGSCAAPDLDALAGRGIVKLWSDDLLGARRDLSAVVEGLPPGVPDRLAALGYLADAEFRLGAWDDATAHAELARSLAEDAEQGWIVAFVTALAARPLAHRGHTDAADELAGRALRAADDTGDVASLTYASTIAAEVALRSGRPQQAALILEALEPHAFADGVDEPGIMPWRHLQAEAWIDLGEPSKAEATLAVFEARAEERRSRSGRVLAASAHARLLEARADRDGAIDLLEETLRSVDLPEGAVIVTEARAQVGSLLRRAGKRRAAAAYLTAASARLRSIGASPALAACERELEACGLRATPTGQSANARPWLTPQETAVAALAASGCTNREIAAQLFISAKTVEYHLANIFAKFGVKSRRALTAELTRQPTDPT